MAVQFDYGHMENGHLGKPYNLRLLKRLIPYTRPHRKSIALALALTLLITLFDLAIPYLPKVAIDKYIVSFWYPVDLEGEARGLAGGFTQRYGHLVAITEEAGLGFVSSSHLNKIDPMDLRLYREKGLIGRERYYRVPAGAVDREGLSPSGVICHDERRKAH